MRSFVDRHIGPNKEEIGEMLGQLGLNSLEELVKKTIPSSIIDKEPLDVSKAMTEYEYLKEVKAIAGKNKVFRSFIGLGYYDTITPAPIQRNIFENPGWYTQYTPYQAEISQGRLEALLNFQTMVSDLTGLPIANASLLDEGTAAAEAMSMFFSARNKRKVEANEFFVDQHVFPQTLSVLQTRAEPLGIKITVGDWKTFTPDEHVFGAIVQYPNAEGHIEDYSSFMDKVQSAGGYVTVAADLLSLTLLTSPSELGADAAIGNTQRFGVPLGFGGPHAAYFATSEKHKRQIPGRIIGVSVDSDNNAALRMALQTREQHIRREKATSNICTAQALLAIMAGMYAVYHGPTGLKNIAREIAAKATGLAQMLKKYNWKIKHGHFFDTISIVVPESQMAFIREGAKKAGFNFLYEKGKVTISLDEKTTLEELDTILSIFDIPENMGQLADPAIPSTLRRKSHYLSHPVFHQHQTETQLMRYIKSLENKDLSLVHSMIPLGSCTMKLNAASELIPVSWDNIAGVHPFVPDDQVKGYTKIIDQLARDLCAITGFAACSFQPNSGAQGEFAGLLAIRDYHRDRNEEHRNVTLIPSSAHGTNPASAVMAGMKVVIVKCDDRGNIDLDDLKEKAGEHAHDLSALMVTYPSTHGVFEESIKEVCQVIHEHGGLVYMDGANMNAQVGLTNPGSIGADVCHLNLHKTFAIPHGGGGPGMGPICVNKKLAGHLPGHRFLSGKKRDQYAVASSPFSSASILLISYGYVKMLGASGLKKCTEIAILNANYIRHRLSSHYDILYVGENGFCAHEFILDLRAYKSAGIGAEDVAKRLIDYGFHAPTLSFPVAGTLMIEPTESEDIGELNRFCEAMIAIREEIDEVARGEYPAESNVLVNAPHNIDVVTRDSWTYPYSREKAAFPLPWLKTTHKFWPAVRRVDNAYGDRSLVCTCPPIESYQES